MVFRKDRGENWQTRTNGNIDGTLSTILDVKPFMLLLFAIFSINIEYFANLIGLAYCSQESLTQNRCSHCTDDFQFIARLERRSTVAVIMRNQTHTLLIFQGSVTFSDWLSDAQILLVPVSELLINTENYFSQAKAHQGFYNAYLSIRQQIWEILDKLNLPVITLGHSMGGSLSTIAALDISKNYSVQLITAESPRTGNKAFIDLLQHKVPFIYRITNENDIIPFLPGLALGYTHTINEIWVHSNTTTICPHPDSKQCISSTWPRNSMQHHAFVGNIHVGGCLNKYY